MRFLSDWPFVVWGRLLFCFGVLVCLSGCGPLSGPIGPVDPASPVVNTEEFPVPDTVWGWIAKDIHEGRIANSTKLELVVARLQQRGNIDASSVDRMYAVFSDGQGRCSIKGHQVDLTTEHALKIKDL